MEPRLSRGRELDVAQGPAARTRCPGSPLRPAGLCIGGSPGKAWRMPSPAAGGVALEPSRPGELRRDGRTHGPGEPSLGGLEAPREGGRGARVLRRECRGGVKGLRANRGRTGLHPYGLCKPGSPCSTSHLRVRRLGHGLSTHERLVDDDADGRQVDAGRQCAGAGKGGNVPLEKPGFDETALVCCEAAVVVAHATREQSSQCGRPFGVGVEVYQEQRAGKV